MNLSLVLAKSVSKRDCKVNLLLKWAFPLLDLVSFVRMKSETNVDCDW